MTKLAWIDQLKGIGIIAVVAGHIYLGPIADSIYLWHMPLFFFLSGYLFQPQPDQAAYFQAKVIHLLVPYFAFLVLFEGQALINLAQTESLTYWAKYIIKDLLGGRYLLGWVGVFWFISCLFITQQLANWLFGRLSLRVLWAGMTVLLVLAYAYAAQAAEWQVASGKWQVPFNADVVLFALPVFFLGWRYKVHGLAKEPRFDLAALVLSIIGLAFIYFGLIRTFNLKYVNYGTPGATLLFCLAAVHLLIRGAQRIPEQSMSGKILASAGSASMIIMFVHAPINLGIQQFITENRDVRMVFASTIPWLLFYLCRRFRVTRAFLLGSGRDLLALRGPKAVP